MNDQRISASRQPTQVDTLAADIRSRLYRLDRFDTQSLRSVRRALSKQLADARPELIINLAERLLETPSFVYRFIAYELIFYHREALFSLRSADLERLGKDLDSWGAVDTFACYLAGPAWREKQIPDRVIHRWAHSTDRWWRRAALVSTVPLNNKARGGQGDTERTLRVCRILIDDRDEMVVKALSWALRELGKCDPSSVYAFVNTFRDHLAKKVLREVNNKLSTGLKTGRAAKPA